jgi:hypothetical protein
MSSKKWLNIFLVLSFCSVGFVGLVNFVVDPLWIFDHSNRLNKLQSGFNERVSKTSYIKYHEDVLKDKDTLLLGASSSTYFDENKFPGYSVYNYSVSSFSPNEYEKFTNFAESVKKENFDNIMLGLDFGLYFFHDDVPLNINDFNDHRILFAVKKYLSLDMIRHSFVNIKRSLDNSTSHRAYTRNNIVRVDKLTEYEVKKIVDNSLEKYMKKSTVDPKYLSSLKSYKEKYSDRHFIVYTPPLAKPFLTKIYSDEKLKNSYIQWIRGITEIFGEIYFFTLPNEFSENYSTDSKDGIHYYPDSGEKIGRVIFNEKMKPNLGIILKRDNINQSLINLNKQIDEYVKNSILSSNGITGSV